MQKKCEHASGMAFFKINDLTCNYPKLEYCLKSLLKLTAQQTNIKIGTPSCAQFLFKKHTLYLDV
jgi:hypothetical protein